MARYTDEDNGYVELEQYIDSALKEYERERRFIEPMWKEISDYLLPRFSGWDFSQDITIEAGAKIFDGSAIAAHSRLADGIFGWLVSPTIPWLKFQPLKKEDEDDKLLMEYLFSLEAYLYDVFNKSNFYDAIAEDIRNSSGIGTAVMVIEDSELGRPIYTPLHPREIYIAENQWREVDTLFRKYQITKRQFLEQFKSCYPDDKQRKEIMNSSQEMVTLLHAVYPNLEFVDDGGLKLGENKKYKSVHKIIAGAPTPKGQKTNILKVSGMDERKFEAHRFNRSSGQVYGTCPSFDAIYDIKMINLQSKTMADVAQLAARPPMQTTELMKGKLRIAPGGVTYGMDPVAPIMTNFSYPIGLDAMNRREQIIKEHFKTEFFQSISQIQQTSRDRTATEIMEIKAEAAAVMGSIVGRVQSERLEPMVRLTLLIEKEADRLPPIPEGLDPKKAFALKFIGPLAQSQEKYLRTQGILNGLGPAIQLSQQAQAPEAMFNFDFNWAVREVAVAGGYPAKGLFSTKDVQKKQDAYAKQQAAIAENNMMNERLKASGQAKGAPEKGSLLEAIMGGR